jgi:hypothetical protein
MTFDQFVQYARRVKREHVNIMNPIWDIVSNTYDKISEEGIPADIQIPIGVRAIEDLVKDIDYARPKKT